MRLVALGAATVAVLATTGLPASATSGDDYGQYSRIAARSAGQYWADGKVAGQWAWKPLSATTSEISWGDPKTWPPNYGEKFVRDGDWVTLDGWSGNGTYYRLRVTKEQIGDAKCENLRTFATSGPQHYVKWDIPATGYCLKAWGTLTEESSGKVIKFGHTQIWSPPAPCSNQYISGQTCIKQWESWWDNKGDLSGPITRKLDRDQYIARDKGMAFRIHQYFPKTWKAEARSYWTW
ncbi:hypothetical protein [Nonomuraea glycinis]|uniref:hypothetical protein n=1 Tax=Nonomuraea glycinis TaxID=2047744 RepID=UPI0033A6E311